MLDLVTVAQDTTVLPIPTLLSRLVPHLLIIQLRKIDWKEDGNQYGTTNFLSRKQLEEALATTSIFTADCRMDTDHAKEVFLHVATEQKL